MISRAEFWRFVDEHAGPGVLVVALLVSWKQIADEVGRDAVDIASGMLNIVGEVAFSRLECSARLSTTTVGGYSLQRDPRTLHLTWFDRWLPMTLTAHNLTVPIDVQRLTIRRAEGQPGSELYAEAQRQLTAMVAGLPEDDQYPALPGGWDEALKG